MAAIRAPFSALGGVVFSVALFLGLAHLVHVPFAAAPTTIVDTIALKPVRPDTPAQTTRDPRPVRELPTLEPGLPNIGVDDGGGVIVERAIYTRPKVDTRPANHGLMRGLDGDVTPIVQTKPDY